MSALNLTVERIDASADALITNLFDLYLHDMAEWFLFDIGDEGRFRYDMSKHWARGDEVYIARCDGKLAGFALVTLAKNVVPDARRLRRRRVFRRSAVSAHRRRRGARESDLGHASGTMAGARLRGQSPSDSVLAQDHLALHERSADRRAPHRQQQGVVVLPLQEQRFVTSTRYRSRACYADRHARSGSQIESRAVRLHRQHLSQPHGRVRAASPVGPAQRHRRRVRRHGRFSACRTTGRAGLSAAARPRRARTPAPNADRRRSSPTRPMSSR